MRMADGGIRMGTPSILAERALSGAASWVGVSRRWMGQLVPRMRGEGGDCSRDGSAALARKSPLGGPAYALFHTRTIAQHP